MCHGPYDPQHLMRDMARRSEDLRAPRWSIRPLLVRVAGWIRPNAVWIPTRPLPDLRPAPIRRDQR
mgnify:CR=1 FL=1